MSLQLRRGTTSQRTGITPAEGELLYTTDTNLLYVGGKTGGTGNLIVGGIPVAPVQTVNGQSGNVALTTDNINEGTYNTYFTTNRAKDAAAALLTGGTNTGVTFSYNSSTQALTTTISAIPSGISGSIAYWAGVGRTLSASQSILWDEANNILSNTDGTFRVISNNNNRSILLSDLYTNNTVANNIAIRRAKGTSASPLPVTYFDDIGYLSFQAHDGAVFSTVANIQVEVADNTTTSIPGTTLHPVANPRIATTAAFASGGIATLTFATQPSLCFYTGQTIVVEGVTPTVFNGTWTITGTPTTSQVQFALAGTYGPQTIAGRIAGNYPGTIAFNVNDYNGNLSARMRVLSTGRVVVGPLFNADTGSGYLDVTSTAGGTGAALTLRNYFSDTNPAIISLRKYRGTLASPLALLAGDSTGQISFRSYDGASTLYTAKIESTVDGAVSTGKTPGALSFFVTNSTGVLTLATKIGNDRTLTHSGTIAAGAVAPGTYWNYDTSASTITLTLGGTVAFANFSGSILVNCYNSGTVTQYLCGGGSTPIAAGSSKVTPTGTMASTSGIAGYTFTATEAGVHSFYVVRTRAGA